MNDITKYKMMFFAPDAGGGEGGSGGEGSGTSAAETKGGAVFDPPAKETTGDPTPPKSGTPPSSGTDGAGTGEPASGEGAGEGEGTPPTGTVDAKAFAAEFGNIIKPLFDRAPTAPTEKQLTPEEAKKLLNVWEPDDAWYKEYDNLETRAAAVTKMRDGLIRQADTINQMRLQQEFAKLREELGPQLSAVQEFTEIQRNERLGKAWPDLAKPELKPLVDAIATDLVKQGKKFNTESELFKALATGVEAVIKVNNPDFKLTAGSTPGDNNKGRSNNSIPVTTPGSGGGAGRRENTNEAPKKRGLAVFDKV